MKNKYVYTFLVFVVNFAIAQDLEILPFKKCLDLCSSETNIYFKEIQNFVKSSNSDYENAGIRPNPVFNTQILFLTDTKYKPIKDKLMYVSEYNRQDWFQITKKTNPFGQRKNGILTAQRNYEHDISQSEIDLMELKYKAANLWINLWLNQNNLILSQKAVKSLDSLINGSKLNPESDEYLRYIILDDQYDLNLINIEEENYVLTQTISRMLNLNSTVKVDSSSFFAFYNEKLKDTAVISNPKLKEIESQLIYDHQNYQFQKKMMVSGPEMGVIANPQTEFLIWEYFLHKQFRFLIKIKKIYLKQKFRWRFLIYENKLGNRNSSLLWIFKNKS